MSRVAVISSNGLAGRLIVEELVARGHEVTGFARQAESGSVAQHYVQKDLFDLTKEDLAGFEVVVSAFGTFAPETLHLHSKVAHHLIDVLAGSAARLYVVGGAGSLYVDEAKAVQLVDTPDFPEEFVPLAKNQGQALAILRESEGVNWTFVSPAADLQADGEKKGQYLLAGDVFTVNEASESAISYADYALAFVDIIESGKYNQERVSVLWK